MYCTKCGKETTQGSNFCRACGHELSEKGSTIDSNHNSKPNNSTLLKNKKSLFIIGAIIAVLIVVLTIRMSKPTPMEVAEQFIIHTQEYNFEEAEKLWSQSGIDYMLSMLGSERWIHQSMKNFTHRTDGELYHYQFTDEERVDANNVTLYADFIFDNGRRNTAKMAMTKENGEWKVFAFDTY